jgi:alginate biosynthesis protein AlgX
MITGCLSLIKGCLTAGMLLGMLTLTDTGVLSAESQFGCANLATNREMPALEGKGGYFFRIQPDLRMHIPMADLAVEDLGRLARALHNRGTTLIYLPVPPKAATMPDLLPDDARLYGFDPQVARQVYKDLVAKLRSNDIVAVDLLGPLTNSPDHIPYFFQADFHWTAEGARRAAAAVAEVIVNDSNYANAATSKFETIKSDNVRFVSAMRRQLQRSCVENLPEAVTPTYVTKEISDDTVPLDIFGNAENSPDTISLVGTSFSDVPEFNFAGFLAQGTSLRVRNLAISGGNQFAAISSYLTSQAFLDDHPRFLIWENPVYNNIAQFGRGPLDELVAAVEGSCLPVSPSAVHLVSPTEMSINLKAIDVQDDDVILADSGNEESRSVSLRFEQGSGRSQVRTVERPSRFRPTGRFYIPIANYHMDGFSTVDVLFDRPGDVPATISLCRGSIWSAVK